MKQELQISLTIRQRIEFLLDIIAEKIIDIGDYTINKKIKWVEVILYFYSILRAVWFIAVGVENKNYDYFFGDAVWTTVFLIMTVIHTTGFFTKSMCLRITAAYMAATVWGILTTIAAISLTRAPAVPSLIPLVIMAIVVVVHLSYEHKKILENVNE